MKFNLHSNFKPSGDQPQAIEELVNGIKLENGNIITETLVTHKNS